MVKRVRSHPKGFIGKGKLRSNKAARKQAFKDIRESGEGVVVTQEKKIRKWIAMKPILFFTKYL